MRSIYCSSDVRHSGWFFWRMPSRGFEDGSSAVLMQMLASEGDVAWCVVLRRRELVISWWASSAVVLFLSCLVFISGFFKCEYYFADVVGMWWLLTSSGSVTPGSAQDVCAPQWNGNAVGGCGRRCWVTQRGLAVGFTVVAGAELDVTQGCHTDGVTVIG